MRAGGVRTYLASAEVVISLQDTWRALSGSWERVEFLLLVKRMY